MITQYDQEKWSFHEFITDILQSNIIAMHAQNIVMSLLTLLTGHLNMLNLFDDQFDSILLVGVNISKEVYSLDSDQFMELHESILMCT